MARASLRSDHPLMGDARDTLRRLHNQAATRAARHDRRLLEQRDELPRGPLPVMARAAAARAEVLHLLIALSALGDRDARLRLRASGRPPPLPRRDGELSR